MSILRIHLRGEVTEAHFQAPLGMDQLLQLHHSPAESPCAGQGTCGKCRVRMTGVLSPATDVERRLLRPEERRQGLRLACQAVALGDVEVWLEAARPEAILTRFTLPALPDYTAASGVGLAIDVGTTTLAAYLYDMQSRSLLAVRAKPNPQRAFGADVTSRLKAALEGEGEALRLAITGTLCDLAQALLADGHRSANQLHQAVVTGNTAMLYLLTGQEPASIAYAPFEPATRLGLEVPGDAVGLPAHTRAFLPACISAYVGADITCAMLYAAARPEHVRKPVLLADIGTNGEMALFTGTRILTCSTAAGPAFEGAGIRFGMTAQAGAISRVDVREDSLAFTVLGDAAARGLCGSGLVDAIAALRTLEVIDETGRMHMGGHSLAPCMETLDGQPTFRFPGTAVLLTQADIRAVQLAKSAICAGMLTLLETAGLSCQALGAVQLAGGFGSCIRPETAQAIGLLPAGTAARTFSLGNAAGAGAAMMLLSPACKAQGAIVSAAQESIDLSTSSAFAAHFMDCMLLDTCE